MTRWPSGLGGGLAKQSHFAFGGFESHQWWKFWFFVCLAFPFIRAKLLTFHVGFTTLFDLLVVSEAECWADFRMDRNDVILFRNVHSKHSDTVWIQKQKNLFWNSWFLTEILHVFSTTRFCWFEVLETTSTAKYQGIPEKESEQKHCYHGNTVSGHSRTPCLSSLIWLHCHRQVQIYGKS